MMGDVNRHFGVIIPASNLTIESEFYRILQKDESLSQRVFLHFARAGFETRYKVSPEAYLTEVVEDIPNEVRKLSKILQLEEIAFCCTSATLYLENNDRVKAQALEYFPKEILTPVGSLIASMQKLKMSEVLLVTPYSSDISVELMKSLNENQIFPKKVVSLNLTTSSEILEYSKEKLFDLISKEMSLDADYDGVCIMCTNFPTVHLLEELECKINKPVVSSNTAILYNLLSESGVALNVKGAGSIFNS